MGRSLLIFSGVNFKMAAWQPFWIFWVPDCNFCLALNVNSKLQWPNTFIDPILCLWVGAYWFSVTSLSKCLVAILDFFVSGLCRRHGFGSVTQVCFGISVSNFMCMYFVAVGRSLTIFSYVAFKMDALWFWEMFNCNPPIAPCYHLLWGGGILVDHWSTTSSMHLCPKHVSPTYSLSSAWFDHTLYKSHYAKLSWAMRAPLMGRFGNN